MTDSFDYSRPSPEAAANFAAVINADQNNAYPNITQTSEWLAIIDFAIEELETSRGDARQARALRILEVASEYAIKERVPQIVKALAQFAIQQSGTRFNGETLRSVAALAKNLDNLEVPGDQDLGIPDEIAALITTFREYVNAELAASIITISGWQATHAASNQYRADALINLLNLSRVDSEIRGNFVRVDAMQQVSNNYDLIIALAAHGLIDRSAMVSFGRNLVRCLEHKDAGVRKAAIAAMTAMVVAQKEDGQTFLINQEDVLTYVERLTEDSDIGVRALATHSLAALARTEGAGPFFDQVLPILSSGLTDDDTSIRTETVRALSTLTESEAVPEEAQTVLHVLQAALSTEGRDVVIGSLTASISDIGIAATKTPGALWSEDSLALEVVFHLIQQTQDANHDKSTAAFNILSNWVSDETARDFLPPRIFYVAVEGVRSRQTERGAASARQLAEKLMLTEIIDEYFVSNAPVEEKRLVLERLTSITNSGVPLISKRVGPALAKLPTSELIELAGKPPLDEDGFLVESSWIFNVCAAAFQQQELARNAVSQGAEGVVKEMDGIAG